VHIWNWKKTNFSRTRKYPCPFTKPYSDCHDVRCSMSAKSSDGFHLLPALQSGIRSHARHLANPPLSLNTTYSIYSPTAQPLAYNKRMSKPPTSDQAFWEEYLFDDSKSDNRSQWETESRRSLTTDFENVVDSLKQLVQHSTQPTSDSHHLEAYTLRYHITQALGSLYASTLKHQQNMTEFVRDGSKPSWTPSNICTLCHHASTG
jgi:hypothetical protein